MVIKASGQALAVGNPRSPNTFMLDLDEGDDVLKISCMMVGPGKPEMWTETLPGGKQVKVSYRIGLVGEYKIHVKYDEKHIEGSPFTMKV